MPPCPLSPALAALREALAPLESAATDFRSDGRLAPLLLVCREQLPGIVRAEQALADLQLAVGALAAAVDEIAAARRPPAPTAATSDRPSDPEADRPEAPAPAPAPAPKPEPAPAAAVRPEADRCLPDVAHRGRVDPAEAYRLREAEGWTLTDIARRMGVSQPAVSQSIRRWLAAQKSTVAPEHEPAPAQEPVPAPEPAPALPLVRVSVMDLVAAPLVGPSDPEPDPQADQRARPTPAQVAEAARESARLSARTRREAQAAAAEQPSDRQRQVWDMVHGIRRDGSRGMSVQQAARRLGLDVAEAGELLAAHRRFLDAANLAKLARPHSNAAITKVD